MYHLVMPPAFMGMILIVAAIAVLYKGTHETV